MRFMIHFFEAWLVARLLRSAAFHRFVRNVHKRGSEIRSGQFFEEKQSGTAIDRPEGPGFSQFFLDEMKKQFRGTPTKDSEIINEVKNLRGKK